MTRISRSEADTRALGAELAGYLKGGEVIFLYGDFGCGKTVLVKGLAGALEIPARTVTSPSFTLVQTYQGRLTLHHVDLYRLEAPEAIDELALEEFVVPTSVVVIEWAQHWSAPTLTPDYRLHFTHGGGDVRRIDIDPAIE